MSSTELSPPGRRPLRLALLAAIVAGFVVLGAVLLLSRSAAEPRPTSVLLGVTVELETLDPAGRTRQTSLARQTGARILRDDFTWAGVEPEPGRWSWQRTDAVVATAARQGVRILPVLHDAPGWADPDPAGFPRDPELYGRYVAAVVERYGHDGAFWAGRPELDRGLAPQWFELGNEPYLVGEAQGGSDPAAYARAVRAAVPRGREAQPGARFLLAADTTATEADGVDRSWLAGMHAAVPDLGRHFDGVAVHPYSGADGPGRYTPGNGDRWQTRRIEALRADLVRRGEKAKPIWITEIGWSTCTADEDCVDEQAQADHLAEVFSLAAERWPWVRAVVVYGLNDYPAPGEDDQGYFGLLRADGSPKPAWGAIQRVAGTPPRDPRM